eukprot:scaffold3658_cov75-Cylindrotheca_fusiformis.AAC.1
MTTPRPPSPSSVRWHYDSNGFPKSNMFQPDNDDEDHDNTNTIIPSKEEMQRRWKFRKMMKEESQRYRRVHTKPTTNRSNSIVHVVQERSIHGKTIQNTNKIQWYAEQYSVTKYKSAFLNHLGLEQDNEEQDQDQQQDNDHSQQQQQQSQGAVSTISIAFSSCGSTMASTHGDHTVKISDCYSGRLLQTLQGHPRTPWTCKYHPINSNIVASGCLGHQVRIWNWKQNTCLSMIRLDCAIISISFHPTGNVLAIANGQKLHFWGLINLLSSTKDNDDDDDNNHDVDHHDPTKNNRNHQQHQQHLYQRRSNNNNNIGERQQQQGIRRQGTTSTSTGVGGSVNEPMTEVNQRHMLRCVHFPPGGTTIIVGGVNVDQQQNNNNNRGTTSRRGGISGGGMSFYLRLWDFDLDATLNPTNTTTTTNAMSTMTHENGLSPAMRRRAISNPRTFVPRALLYNDGGFDVSPDGKTICACAEYWLPDGIDNAMDLLKQQQQKQNTSNCNNNNEDDDEDDDEEQMSSFRTTTDAAADWASMAPPPPQQQQRTAPRSRAEALASEKESRLSELRRARGGAQRRAQRATATATAARSPPQQLLQQASAAAQAATATARSPPLPRPPQTPSSLQDQDQDVYSPTPQTPPPPNPLNGGGRSSMRTLSPPSPPGRRFVGGVHERLPPPPPGMMSYHATTTSNEPKGRYVPHVVTISLDTAPASPNDDLLSSTTTEPNHLQPMLHPPNHPHSPFYHHHHSNLNVNNHYNNNFNTIDSNNNNNHNKKQKKKPKEEEDDDDVDVEMRPRLGQLLQACPLDGAKASAVTCVKFSPSTNFCLIGYGVREPIMMEDESSSIPLHPVTALYATTPHMTHVSTMLSADDDVNIARFHPHS